MTQLAAWHASPNRTFAARRRIFNWIGIINQLSTTRISRALPPLKLPFPQFVLLIHFSHRPEEAKTVTGVAAAMQQPQPGITKTIQKMLARKLLRAAPAPGDARSKLSPSRRRGSSFKHARLRCSGRALPRSSAAGTSARWTSSRKGSTVSRCGSIRTGGSRSGHLGSPRDDAFGPRAHLRRGQTCRNSLVARRARIGGNQTRRTVIGRTEDDRLVLAHLGQIQNCIRTREKEERPCARSTGLANTPSAPLAMRRRDRAPPCRRRARRALRLPTPSAARVGSPMRRRLHP